MRISKTQRAILIVLAAGFVGGVKSIESPDLRLAVETMEKSGPIDRSNFKKGLDVLVENGLIMREDIVHEVWYNITPKGFDEAVKRR